MSRFEHGTEVEVLAHPNVRGGARGRVVETRRMNDKEFVTVLVEQEDYTNQRMLPVLSCGLPGPVRVVVPVDHVINPQVLA